MTEKRIHPSLNVCSTRDVAMMLGISVRTAQLWVEEGRLQAWKTPGGHRRILRESVERLLEQQRQAGIHAEQSLRILVLQEFVEQGDYVKQVLSKQLPDVECTVTDAFEGLIQLGEQHVDVVIAVLDPTQPGNLRLLYALARHEFPDGLLKILILPDRRGEAVADSELGHDFIILNDPPGSSSTAAALIATVRASCNGVRWRGR